jgi:2-methylisocitrate lyase-like PEP mutase family enzyme
MVFGGKTPILPATDLARMGYAGVIYANAALQASINAMGDVLRHLRRTGSIAGAEGGLATFQERQAVVDQARFAADDQYYASLDLNGEAATQ